MIKKSMSLAAFKEWRMKDNDHVILRVITKKKNVYIIDGTEKIFTVQ